MHIVRKLFLKWLIYITLSIFGACVLLFFNVPQITYLHDHTYLATLVFGVYVVGEILSARRIIKLSTEAEKAALVISIFHEHPTAQLVIKSNDIVLVTQEGTYQLPKSIIKNHLKDLAIMAKNGENKYIVSDVLMDTLADKIYFRNSIGDFIGNEIVWIGIFATILGVILAFWPYINMRTFEIEAMRSSMGDFFRGIAIAFVPTAVSFVFKVLLDINGRILEGGASEFLETITKLDHVYVIPKLVSNEQA